MLENSPPPKNWKNKRIKTPTILQMEAVECGAASLAMILAYHGAYVPLAQLRFECGVSRDGSKASNLLKAARPYGMKAKGFRKELNQLNELPLPMILFWNFNHFVVLEGIRGKWAYLNDPGSGPRRVSMEELNQAFTGVALTFEKGPDFKKFGKKPTIYRSLIERFHGCGPALTFVVLAGLLLVIPGLIIPTFMKVFLDDLLIAGMREWLRPLLIAMALTGLVQVSLAWIRRYYLLRMHLRLALSGSVRFFQHVFHLPIRFFQQRMEGDIANRVQLNDKVANLLSGQLAITVVNLLTVVFYALLMFQYNVMLSAIGMSFALLNLLALRLVSSRRKHLNMALQQDYGKMMGSVMTAFKMIETLKAGGAESDFFSQWAGYQAKYVSAQQRLSVASQVLSTIPAMLSSLNHVVMLTLGAWLIMDGRLTIGALFSFQALMSGFMGPFNHFVNMGSLLQETHADINRLDDIVANPADSHNALPALEWSQQPGHAAKLAGRLELTELAFGYSPLEPPLIQDFSLLLTPGARVALVGSSGSGKSTVAKLVAGIYQPSAGTIQLDGHHTSEVPKAVLAESMAMVDQDIFLFEGTIRDNITMWDPTIPEKDLIQAARDACIHDDIMARTNGYDGKIDEGGGNFSGGQRQRLEIARALAVNPTLMIMDEATSALDPNTEKQVDDNLRKRGCTCLIIAHRLSTIRDCDEIIVLDHGRVAQRGAHDTLIQQEGLYAELIRAQ